MHPDYKRLIRAVIRKNIDFGIQWKVTGTKHYGMIHFEKRLKRKDLPKDWVLKDYNNLIMNIMTDVQSDAHLYVLSNFDKRYFCFDQEQWIVIVGEDGLMETCMRGKPHNYFINNPGYTYLGKVKDVFE